MNFACSAITSLQRLAHIQHRNYNQQTERFGKAGGTVDLFMRVTKEKDRRMDILNRVVR